MFVARRGRLLLLTLVGILLTGCGQDKSAQSSAIPIADRGFVSSGIFAGALSDNTQVLLVMQAPDYFLQAGNFVSKGNYTIAGIELSATGDAYDLSATDQHVGNVQLRGEYKTDRHIQLTWQDPVTGTEQTVIMEASDLYFKDSPIDTVLGSWINQDQGNLTFFNISKNHSPVAVDDFFPAQAGVQIEVPVLQNDWDADGDTIYVTKVDAASSAGGHVLLDDNGTPDDHSDDRVLYTPPTSLTSGTDTFGYDITDPSDGTDHTTVTLTLPARQADVSLSAVADNEAPLAGDEVNVTFTVTNNGETDAQVQTGIKLPSGLSYRDDDGGGTYTPDKRSWVVNLPAHEQRSLNLGLYVADHGEYVLDVGIQTMDATDLDTSDNEVSIEFVPGDLNDSPPPDPASAQIQGVILSSLTQIKGTITEARSGFNAYSVSLDIASGGLGSSSGQTDPYTGFVIISEELVDTSGSSSNTSSSNTTTSNNNSGTSTSSGTTGSGTSSTSTSTSEMRPTMLILTANPAGVYLNKLFYVTQEELQQSGN